MTEYQTYIVRCADGTLYTGIARDVTKRLAVHNAGDGAKYTRARRPVVLVWQSDVTDERTARRTEWYIKRLSRREKDALIDGDARVRAKIAAWLAARP